MPLGLYENRSWETACNIQSDLNKYTLIAYPSRSDCTQQIRTFKSHSLSFRRATINSAVVKYYRCFALQAVYYNFDSGADMLGAWGCIDNLTVKASHLRINFQAAHNLKFDW